MCIKRRTVVIKKIALFTFYFLYISSISCTSSISESKQPEKRKDKMNIEVIQLIENCPAWSEISISDKSALDKISICLEKVSKYETNVIRDAIRIYLTDRQSKNTYYVSEMSRLFLLNRYIFNIPSEPVPLRQVIPYGGWAGRPMDGQKIDLLWPFTIGTDNKLHLTARFQGYGGPSYSGLEEFDDLNKKYGRRKSSLGENR